MWCTPTAQVGETLSVSRMSSIGERELRLQPRVLGSISYPIGCRYLDQRREWIDSRNADRALLCVWLQRRGEGALLSGHARYGMYKAAALGRSKDYCDAKREFCGVMRYGENLAPTAGRPHDLRSRRRRLGDAARRTAKERFPLARSKRGNWRRACADGGSEVFWAFLSRTADAPAEDRRISRLRRSAKTYGAHAPTREPSRQSRFPPANGSPKLVVAAHPQRSATDPRNADGRAGSIRPPRATRTPRPPERSAHGTEPFGQFGAMYCAGDPKRQLACAT